MEACKEKWARPRHGVRKCIFLNREGRLAEDSKASRAVLKGSCWSSNLKVTQEEQLEWGLHQRKAFMRKLKWKKAPCARAVTWKLGRAYGTARLCSQSPGWPTDMRAVTPDNHTLSKIQFCFYGRVRKARNDASSELMQIGQALNNGGMKSTADCFLSKQLHIRQKRQGQHKRIFTKCSWSESTPTLKEKNKRQMRSWSQKKKKKSLFTHVCCQATTFFNAEAMEWLTFSCFSLVVDINFWLLPLSLATAESLGKQGLLMSIFLQPHLPFSEQ